MLPEYKKMEINQGSFLDQLNQVPYHLTDSADTQARIDELVYESL